MLFFVLLTPSFGRKIIRSEYDGLAIWLLVCLVNDAVLVAWSRDQLYHRFRELAATPVYRRVFRPRTSTSFSPLQSP